MSVVWSSCWLWDYIPSSLPPCPRHTEHSCYGKVQWASGFQTIFIWVISRLKEEGSAQTCSFQTFKLLYSNSIESKQLNQRMFQLALSSGAKQEYWVKKNIFKHHTKYPKEYWHHTVIKPSSLSPVLLPVFTLHITCKSVCRPPPSSSSKFQGCQHQHSFFRCFFTWSSQLTQAGWQKLKPATYRIMLGWWRDTCSSWAKRPLMWSSYKAPVPTFVFANSKQ